MNNQQFGEMVTQYEKLVYTICYQFTKNHHTAQDLAQETFISAYNHIESCPPDSIKPWLARIATNKAKDYLKSAYNRRVQAQNEETMGEKAVPLFMEDSRPEDIAIEKEALAGITQEIKNLKEPYVTVAVLFFLEEKSVDEIAGQLKRPPKTVHTQLYRAKKILQGKMQRHTQDNTKGENQNGTVS